MKLGTNNDWKKFLALTTAVLLFGYFSPIYAALQPNASFNSIMEHLLTTLPAIVRLIFAISYVMGIWFIYSAVQELKAFGAAHLSKPSTAKVSPSIIRLFIGSMLLFAPGLIDITTYSLWGYGADSIIQYSSGATTSMGWAPVIKGTEALIRVVGYVSFIRGLILVNKGSKGGAPHGTTTKGITHMLGGILAINIVGTIELIKASLGM